MESLVRECYANCRDFDLVTDSRRVTTPARTLFCALVGRRSDGHDYLVELHRRGVRHFIVTDAARVGQPELAGARLYPVADAETFLLRLAGRKRQDFRGRLIAITGSNGKTMVKDWLLQVLATRARVVGSPRSYNSRLGVALSLWQLRPEHEYAVIELGISEAGDAARLTGTVRPDLGVLTNIGSAHDGGFPSRAAKIREKLDLLAGSVLLLPDDPAVTAQLTAEDAVLERWSPVGTTGVRMGEREVTYELPFASPVLTYNARVVIAVLHILYPKTDFQPELLQLRPLANRLEQRAGRAGGYIINDSYSNDLDALAAALDFAERQHPDRPLILVLGDIQPGPDLRSRLQQLLRGRVDRLLTVGSAIGGLTEGLPGRRHFNGTDELLAIADALPFDGGVTLVKGNHRQQLSRLVDRIARPRHRTELETDLRALRHNFGVYAGLVPAATQKIVMVKAGAYGGGLLPVARALVAAGADRLAVAYPGEGRQLRAAGLTHPVMVLNVDAEELADCRQYGLEPVVDRPTTLDRAARLGLRVHLEIDTGMGRLGFPPAALPAALTAPDTLPEIASVFTHLAGSEAAELDDFTHRQVAAFTAAYDRLLSLLGYAPPRHLLNSNGVSRFPEYAYEMVRLGIGLYGTGDARLADRLQPASRFTARITALSHRPAGATVGYNRRGMLERPSTIAVLSVGYADGLPRLAGEGRFAVRIADRLAPTVGAICMDMCMVDVTDIPAAREGMQAVLFGPDHPIGLLAAAARTIPYEILTGVGERVHRIYLGE